MPETSLRDYWTQFFKDANINEADCTMFVQKFLEHRMKPNCLRQLNEIHLEKIGILNLGDQLSILDQAKSRVSAEAVVARELTNEVLKNSSAEISSNKSNSPPKKKLKKKEFRKVLEKCNGNFALLAAEASSIITNLEDKLIVLVDASKMQVIPNKLRHAMEMFPIRVLSSVEKSLRRQRELHASFTKAIDPAWKVNQVDQLCKVLINTQLPLIAATEKSLEDVWNRLRSLEFYSPNNPSEFSNAILEFTEASSFIDAKQLYEKQVDHIWAPRRLKSKLADCDKRSIQDLCRNKLNHILECISSTKDLTNNSMEVGYLTDAVILGKIFQDDVSKHYKKMFWIMYTCDHFVVKNIKAALETEWPDLDEKARIDRYCTEFDKLYNIVSTLSKHGPGQLLPDACKPTETDYSKYIDHLTVTEGKHLSVVAKTLYTPLNTPES